MTSTDIGFVNLDFTRQGKFTVNLRHVVSDLMTDAPCRLVSNAKLPFQLFRGNAMPGRGEQVNRVEPRLQRSAAIFKQCARRRVNVMSAPLTGESASGSHARPVGFLGALRANMALAKATFKDVLQAGLVIRELGEKFFDRDAGAFFVSFHTLNLC
jgi:hypothetical protein